MLHLLPFCLLLTFALVSSSSNVLVDTRDVTLAISEDAANSAGSVYTTAGKLDFSGKLPDNTTTAKLKKLIPQAYALCPDCPINFRVYATEPPRATFRTANGATLQVQNAKLNLTAAAVAAGSPVSELMVLAVNASCGLNFTNNPASSGDYIKPSITIVQIHLIVDSSNVGVLASAAVALLGPLVDTFLKNVVIPEFNKMFPGFPLPTVKGFTITDFLITTNDGYIGVGLDIAPAAPTASTAPTTLPAPPAAPATPMKRALVAANPPGFTGPGVVGTIGGQGLQKILNGLIPMIVKEVNGIVIPAMSGKASGIEYSIGAIAVGGFTVGGSSLTFVEGKGLNLKLGGLGLALPSTSFRIKKKILFTHVSCSGHFNGGLANTGVNVGINISAIEPKGTPKITSVSTWTWGPLNVNVKLSNVFCKIIKDIASWFIGNINSKIENVIKSKIPPLINNLINTKGNEILSDLVLNKNIGKDAAVTYYLTQNPTSANDALSVYLSGEFVKPTTVASGDN